MSDTFVELFLAGRAQPEDVDDFVDLWHEGGDPRPLAEFLGLTQAEYARWVAGKASLADILHARPYPAAQSSTTAEEAREDEEPYGPR